MTGASEPAPLRPSAARVVVVGADVSDLTVLVVAHLEAWGVEVVGPLAAGTRAGTGSGAELPEADVDALVLDVTAVGEPAAAVVAAAHAREVPVVAIALDPESADALDAALATTDEREPSELLVGVPRGRDLFEALESAVTSTRDEVDARVRPPE